MIRKTCYVLNVPRYVCDVKLLRVTGNVLRL